MLEFIGFIALLAIIFGVSFTTALTGFFRVVLIVIAICAVIVVAVKICKKLWGAIVVLVAGLLAIYLGCITIEDNAYSKKLEMCGALSLGPSCVLSAADQHNENLNKGWGFLIGGSAAAVGGVGFALVRYGELSDSKKH